ncbi:hypothetical protein BH23VER1_BH23VER1_25240 [soil metagenome]
MVTMRGPPLGTFPLAPMLPSTRPVAHAFAGCLAILLCGGGILVAESPPAGSPLADVLAKADPTADLAWRTEAFNDHASHQLGAVVAHLVPGKPGAPELGAIVVGPGFASPPLRPELAAVASPHGYRVLRPEPTQETAAMLSGADALARALSPMREALGELGQNAHAKTKVVRIVPAGEGHYRTLVYLEVSNGRGVQQNAEWECHWDASGDRFERPLLSRIEVLRFEEIHADSPAMFTDCTEAMLGENASFGGQLLHGAPHWHGNLDVAFGIYQGNQGLAIGDANGDGLEDLYLCQPDGLPNLLFLRNPDGTLTDASKASGLDVLDISRSALFVDLDNDGDQDLVLTHRFSVSVFENTGSAQFVRRLTIPLESRVAGVSAADFDHDGDLDFYVCGYSPRSKTSLSDIFANPVPYHDARNGAFNYLFRNDGDFTFTDASAETGMADQNNTQFSFTATWEDFDNDGDLDLYVANDFGRNNLYRNALVPTGTATFEDVAAETATEDIAAGMSAAWGDYNRDGLMDLYVSNMWSSAGNRITFQDQFRTGGDQGEKALMQRHARGNSLFKNAGADTPFDDVSIATGTEMGRWAWGSLFMDLNNDGWEDLYVANGFMTAPDTGDL